MATVIELERISKSFAIPSERRATVRDHIFGLFRPRRFERLQVLDQISVKVEKGETLGIMGRNGCGKSTLLKILCGIYQPETGRVVVSAPLTPILELGIGWNQELDAVDNILLIGTAMGLTLDEAKAAVDPVLEFSGLERFKSLSVKHYSSGMAARLSYAVAFHAVQEVLILDEVLAVGDAGFKEKCEKRFERLIAKGRTGVLVSHSPAMIAQFCSRAILLDGGRIACEGKPDEVIAAYNKVNGL